MEFPFDLQNVLGEKNETITMWDRKKLLSLRPNSRVQLIVNQVIDQMGRASSKAQNLPHQLTSASKLAASDHHLYIYAIKNKAIGILKVGLKKLFIRTETGVYREIEPLCVLDFYVHESTQRKGCGLELFRKMLHDEQIEARKMAYDRPSIKLLSFLKKHFNLYEYIPQANNFVVFNDYFNDYGISFSHFNIRIEEKKSELATISMRPLTAQRNTSPRRFNQISNTMNTEYSKGKYEEITPKPNESPTIRTPTGKYTRFGDQDDYSFTSVLNMNRKETPPGTPQFVSPVREATLIKQFYANKPRPF